MEQVVSPVCSNVHFIRIAKFMKQISMAFGYEENLPEFERDMERVKNALLAYAWDEESRGRRESIFCGLRQEKIITRE